jgi:hypothetical protein
LAAITPRRCLRPLAASGHLPAGAPIMKFTVEVLRLSADTDAEVLHRVSIDRMSPKWAQSMAASLLDTWRRRGANATRLLNQNGEELYLKKD